MYLKLTVAITSLTNYFPHFRVTEIAADVFIQANCFINTEILVEPLPYTNDDDGGGNGEQIGVHAYHFPFRLLI